MDLTSVKRETMAARSFGGTTWLTKLQRIGELSTRDKSMVFNNLGHVIDVEWLQEIYRQIDGTKAVGIDKVTKEKYGRELEKNLAALIKRIRTGQYHPKPARIVEIPKADGSFRPLAISCFEDKLVQLAVSQILGKIYEPIFLPCSFGFRPNKNCHDALKALNQASFKFQEGAVVEIDIRKYFNTIPHGPLFEFLRKKISDNGFLKLIDSLVKMPTMQNGVEAVNNTGSPQGSIVSPVLSNIFLHYVIDEWFEEISKTHLKGETCEIRFADDLVFVFSSQTQAERFYKVLPKRLGKYGLEMHKEKSNLLPSGRKAVAKILQQGQRIPTYKFLGFTCYWGLSRNSASLRLKFKSRGDRLNKTMQSMREFLRKNLNTRDTRALLSLVKARVRGWINYHAVSDNQRQVQNFVLHSKRIIFNWFNRRGGKKKWNWDRFTKLLQRISYPSKFNTVSLFPPLNKAKA